VALSGGSTQIRIESAAGATLWVDGVLVPDAAGNNAASVHMQAAQLDVPNFDDLSAYLLSLDASDSQSGAASVTATIRLFDATSGESLGVLFDGAILPSQWAERSLTLEVSPSAEIGSAEIVVNQLAAQTENFAPYFAFGDSGGDIVGRGRVLGEGRHRVTYVLYSERNLAGTVLGSMSLDFSVEASASTPNTPEIVKIDVGDSEIILWLSSNNNDDAGFQYQASCSDGSAEVVAVASGSRIVVSGLVNDRAYRCRVTALSDQGVSSPPSAETSGLTPESISAGLPIWLLYEVLRASQASPAQ
jgi:hypothetical protein